MGEVAESIILHIHELAVKYIGVILRTEHLRIAACPVGRTTIILSIAGSDDWKLKASIDDIVDSTTESMTAK